MTHYYKHEGLREEDRNALIPAILKQTEPEAEPEEEYTEQGCYSPNGDPVNMMPHDWTDAGEGFSRCRICGKVVE